MSIPTRRWFGLPLAVPLALILASCSSSKANSASDGPCTPAKLPVVNFAAYSTPREVYDAKIIPAFVAKWKEDHNGQSVKASAGIPSASTTMTTPLMLRFPSHA